MLTNVLTGFLELYCDFSELVSYLGSNVRLDIEDKSITSSLKYSSKLNSTTVTFHIDAVDSTLPQNVGLCCIYRDNEDFSHSPNCQDLIVERMYSIHIYYSLIHSFICSLTHSNL